MREVIKVIITNSNFWLFMYGVTKIIYKII